MSTIILSAFQPFGSYRRNITKETARLTNGTSLGGYKIVARIFRATIPPPGENRGQILVDIAKKHRASGIICLGMSSLQKGICAVKAARNRIESNYCPNQSGPVDTTRPLDDRLGYDLALWRLPIFRTKCNETSIPIEDESDDAGGFCCNHLAYQLQLCLQALPKPERIPCIYFHVPTSRECWRYPNVLVKNGKITMTRVQIKEALRILLSNADLVR